MYTKIQTSKHKILIRKSKYKTQESKPTKIEGDTTRSSLAQLGESVRNEA